MFDPETRAKAAGRIRGLLMDGHDSHYSYELLDYADSVGIVLLGYVPHATHVLQGLDVVCFAIMKKWFEQSIRQFEEEKKRTVKKEDFLRVFGKAFIQSFTRETNKKVFEATGIVPFNPNVVTADDMAPSKATSTRGTFPQALNSPQKAIMMVFRQNPPTPMAIDPDNTDPNLDPQLFTPTKRKRQLYGSLAATKSGSYLVSNQKWKSVNPIPPPVFERLPEIGTPDWSLIQQVRNPGYKTREQLLAENQVLGAHLELAHSVVCGQQHIMEQTTAQTVLQDMLLHKLNSALYEKENEKEEDRTRLFPEGLGRTMTDREFRAETRRVDARRKEKLQQKENRAEARLRHNMGIALPGYPPTGTRHMQVPAYVIPTGITTG